MDHFRKAKSLFSTTSNSFSTGVNETVTLETPGTLSTDTETVLTFDRRVEDKLERIRGVVSGNNFVISERGVDGTVEQSHTTPIVEYIPNAADINDMVDGLLEEHNQDGTHGAVTAESLTMGGDIAMSSNKIVGLADPGDDQDAATKKYVDAEVAAIPTPGGDGWTGAGETWTYASATSFTVAGTDVTAKYHKGTRLKLTQSTGGTKYFVVTSSSFSTNTTVNITAGTTHTLNNEAISSPFYSYQSNPQGYPATFSYTPTVTAESGSYASVSATGKFRVIGKTCFTNVKVTLTTIGTGANAMDITLPVTADASATYFASAWIDAGTTASGFLNSTTSMKIKRYDNTHPGTTGNNIYVFTCFDF